MTYFLTFVLYFRKGRKYCYGDSEGEYCHCDYCKCKHGYGLKVDLYLDNLGGNGNQRLALVFLLCFLKLFKRSFMHLLSRAKEAMGTVAVVDTKGDEKTR